MCRESECFHPHWGSAHPPSAYPLLPPQPRQFCIHPLRKMPGLTRLIAERLLKYFLKFLLQMQNLSSVTLSSCFPMVGLIFSSTIRITIPLSSIPLLPARPDIWMYSPEEIWTDITKVLSLGENLVKTYSYSFFLIKYTSTSNIVQKTPQNPRLKTRTFRSVSENTKLQKHLRVTFKFQLQMIKSIPTGKYQLIHWHKKKSLS